MRRMAYAARFTVFVVDVGARDAAGCAGINTAESDVQRNNGDVAAAAMVATSRPQRLRRPRVSARSGGRGCGTKLSNDEPQWLQPVPRAG